MTLHSEWRITIHNARIHGSRLQVAKLCWLHKASDTTATKQPQSTHTQPEPQITTPMQIRTQLSSYCKSDQPLMRVTIDELPALVNSLRAVTWCIAVAPAPPRPPARKAPAPRRRMRRWASASSAVRRGGPAAPRPPSTDRWLRRNRCPTPAEARCPPEALEGFTTRSCKPSKT